MRGAMEEAGLVARCGVSNSAGSQHPLLMVLEPEAAAIYCQARAPCVGHIA